MSDWSEGYMADVGYTYGYYTELNPLRTRLAFLHAGLVPPEMAAACELGFGQGVSMNMHAAGAPRVRWWGTDFNPAQAGGAQEMAAAASSGATVVDEAFEQFCRRDDLPAFDFIGLHGIWSWISDENRRIVVDFIRRRLKVGGVVYVSYNVQPGWAQMVPMRHLLTRHADTLGASGQGIVRRIDGALDFAIDMLKLNPAFARAHPQVQQRIEKMKEQNRHYLAHEYFNRDWHPMHFLEMADWLAPAKLDFACSAHYMDHVDAVNLTPEQAEFMRKLPDPMFREAVRDFMANAQFRRDYWVKGARRLTPVEQAEALRAQRVMLVAPRGEVVLKVTATLGEATLSAGVYEPVLDALADNKPVTLGQLEQFVRRRGVNFAQLLQAIMILVGKGDLAAVQDERAVEAARAHCAGLNRLFMQRARGSNDMAYLASPMTGGGVPVNRFQQLFLLAQQSGLKTPQDWTQMVWQLLQAQGQRLIHEGRMLESDEANRAELLRQAEKFQQDRLPMLQALQIT